MANTNITLAGASIQVIDAATNIFRVNSPVGTIVLADTVAFYDSFFQALVAGSTITLPATTVYVVYVKNLDSANNVTVNWTPAGGAASNIGVLIPGSVLLYWASKTGVPSAGGITTLTLTASGATVPCEVLLGA